MSDKALSEFEKCKEIDPDNYLTYFGMGEYYLAIENYQNAIENYKKTIELLRINPVQNMSTFYGNLGFAYKKAEQYEFAIEQYEIALNSNSNNKRVLFHLGELLIITSKDKIRGIELLTKASELGDNDAKVLLNKI